MSARAALILSESRGRQSLWNVALNYAILYALPPLYMAMGRGVSVSIITFILSILAGVIANYVSKRLDERETDGDEPRD